MRYQKENEVFKTNNHKQTMKGGQGEGGIYSRGKKKDRNRNKKYSSVLRH